MSIHKERGFPFSISFELSTVLSERFNFCPLDEKFTIFVCKALRAFHPFIPLDFIEIDLEKYLLLKIYSDQKQKEIAHIEVVSFPTSILIENE